VHYSISDVLRCVIRRQRNAQYATCELVHEGKDLSVFSRCPPDIVDVADEVGPRAEAKVAQVHSASFVVRDLRTPAYAAKSNVDAKVCTCLRPPVEATHEVPGLGRSQVTLPIMALTEGTDAILRR